ALVAIRNVESGAAAEHKPLPPVGPEFIGRRDGRRAVAVEGAARRHTEGHVERLREVLRLGEEEAWDDLQVSKIRLVLGAGCTPVRDRYRDVEAKLKALVERQI